MVKKLKLDNLINKRIEIIKAEIGALLFNLGKTHVGFNHWREHFDINEEEFRKKYGYSTYEYYQDYCKEQDNIIRFKYDLNKVNKKLEELFYETGIDLDEKLKLSDIISGEESSKKLVKKAFLNGCEKVNSGIDKGQPPDRQQLERLWISNAFGGFKKDVSVYMLDRQRICFFNKLWVEISKKKKENKDYSLNFWIAIRKFILKEIKNWYSHLLSDSRFPINDVALWDQAYMTASLFKASLAAIQIDRSIRDTYLKNPRTIKWSILGVQYDKLGIAEKALKPHFLIWYRDATKKVDDKVKQLIETQYALGNEIYIDETGIYFIVPENIGEKNGEDYNLQLNKNLNEVKEKIIEIFENEFGHEAYPSIFVTKPSRGTMNIAYLIEKSKENFLKSFYSKEFVNRCKDVVTNTNDKSSDSEDYHGLCQVCRLEKGKKEKEYTICDKCKEREERRISKWIKKINNETIWTGDLQDKNGRIALLTVKFELKEWLNGNMLNTTLVTSTDWSKIKKRLAQDLKDENRRKKNASESILKEVIKTFPGKLKEGTKNILLERSIGDRWESFLQDFLIKNKIDFDNKKIEWDKLSAQDFDFLAEVLLQFLLRKNPSPARFRRIWETTSEFFIELKNELEDSMKIEKWRTKRIVWKNAVEDKHFRNKEYTYKGLDFWVDNEGNVYLISSIEKAIPIIGDANGEDDIKIIKEKVERNKTDWIREFNLKKYYTKEKTYIKLSNEDAQYEPYSPYLSIIDPTPISWQFIIPAQYVPNVIDNIQEKYKKEFKYVVGKLPVHIGVVVQDYKKPLYIGLKALRKIRRDVNNWEDIKKEIKYTDFKKIQKKYFDIRDVKETNKPQDYYSLYPIAKTEDKYDYEFYITPNEEKKKKLVTVDVTSDSQDKKDEKIKLEIYPNTLDFEFLDTNIRRNDIFYEGGKRILEEKNNRPYTWEEWENFKKFKKYFKDNQKINKLNQMVSLIYSKIKDWEDNEKSLKQFILSAFINVFELNDRDDKKSKEKKDTFAQIFGQEMTWDKLRNIPSNDFKQLLWKFIDMYEFWHKALKIF